MQPREREPLLKTLLSECAHQNPIAMLGFGAMRANVMTYIKLDKVSHRPEVLNPCAIYLVNGMAENRM